jgi:hypothetical protein
MPKARRQHGLRAIEAARKALAAQTASGNDPRGNREINSKRGEAIAEGHRRNREWVQEHGELTRDEACFLREVVPKLNHHSLNGIAKVTGLSLAACSRIRAGKRVPHSRHWSALLARWLGSYPEADRQPILTNLNAGANIDGCRYSGVALQQRLWKQILSQLPLFSRRSRTLTA